MCAESISPGGSCLFSDRYSVWHVKAPAPVVPKGCSVEQVGGESQPRLVWIVAAAATRYLCPVVGG